MSAAAQDHPAPCCVRKPTRVVSQGRVAQAAENRSAYRNRSETARMASLFASVEMAPRDPILGLNEQFNADPNPKKVNLGVGVYTDDQGKLPLLRCVAEAERQVLTTPKARGYLPIEGLAAYDQAVQALVFGAEHEAVLGKRIVTAQALGGTGALKLGADFLKRLQPQAQVLISDPSWENHRALFEAAGFAVNTYPYYDAQARGVQVQGMLDTLRQSAAGTIVVLHACCHNPTGYDLSDAQWDQVVEVVRERGLVAFLDMAYQGFGSGLQDDGKVIGKFLDAGLGFFVSTSFSKSFSLYGERVGALSIVTSAAEEAARVLSQLKRVIRTNYSNPPTHGAQVVAKVLHTAELRQLWEQELGDMRMRIQSMRTQLVEALQAAGVQGDLSYITRQRGMFSYSGLDAAQMQRLRADFGVYGVDSGRICVAALNSGNLASVAQAIRAVM